MRASRRWLEATPLFRRGERRSDRAAFFFWRRAPKKFSNFFEGSAQTTLGRQIGKIYAIRFYRIGQHDWRKMLRHVTDCRCVASRADVESTALSIDSRKGQVESRADVVAEAVCAAGRVCLRLRTSRRGVGR